MLITLLVFLPQWQWRPKFLLSVSDPSQAAGGWLMALEDTKKMSHVPLEWRSFAGFSQGCGVVVFWSTFVGICAC